MLNNIKTSLPFKYYVANKGVNADITECTKTHVSKNMYLLKVKDTEDEMMK